MFAKFNRSKVTLIDSKFIYTGEANIKRVKKAIMNV